MERWIDWRADGTTVGVGPVFTYGFAGAGEHLVSALPFGDSGGEGESRRLTIYSARIKNFESGRDILENGVTYTFEVETTPPGFEDYVNWFASTKFGTVSTSHGRGPSFTVRFDDTWGVLPTDPPIDFQWLGVQADNAFFNQDQKPQPQTVIITPAAVDTVETQDLVTILAHTSPPMDPKHAISASVQLLPDAGGPPINLGSGDIRYSSDPRLVRAEWDASTYPPGGYKIRVAIGQGPPDSAHVVVHPAPSVDLSLQSVSAVDPSHLSITLHAIPSSTVGTPIVKYLWSPGDGALQTETAVPTFTHTYAVGDTYIVWVEAQDALGGSNLASRDLLVPTAVPSSVDLQQTQDCGCKSMTISAGPPAITGAYCIGTVNGVVPERLRTKLAETGAVQMGAAGTNGCPPGQVPYRMPLGQGVLTVEGVPTIGWGFEANVALSDNTNDATRCSQGQYGRGDELVDNALIASFASFKDGEGAAQPPSGQQTLPGGSGGAGGFGFTAVGAGENYPPFGGPKYGPDDYHKPKSTKRHEPGTFRWFDQPQLGAENAVALEHKWDFIAFVRGSKGNNSTCWCRFQISQKWTQAGGLAGTNKIEIIDGQHCFPGPGVQGAAWP